MLFRSIVGDPNDGVQSYGETMGTWTGRAVESATLGAVGDEMAAGASALFGADYEAELARRRQNEENLGTWGKLSADLVGGLVPGVGAAKLIGAAATPLGAIGRGLASGAGAGAVQGAMEGEGGALARLESAKEGAKFGGAVGAAVPAAGAMLGRGVAAFKDWRRNSAVEGALASKLGVGDDAARVLRQGVDIEDPAQIAAAMARGGDEAMLADMPSLAGRLDGYINRPGPAGSLGRQRVEARAQWAADRLTKTLDDTLGQVDGVAQMSKEVAQKTAASRKAAYDLAYSRPISYAMPEPGVAMSPGVEAARKLVDLQKRLPPQAVEYANRLMRLKGEESAQILAKVADDGSVTMMKLPDVRQWDYIKQALDQLAESGDGAGALGGQTRIGAAYQGLAKDVRDNLKKAVPAYGKALDTAADAITERNAISYGADLLKDKLRHHDVLDWVRSATKPELTAARRGLRSEIDHILGRVRALPTNNSEDVTELARVWGQLNTRNNQLKMKLLLREDYVKVAKALEEAGSALGLRNRVAIGSQTAPRQQANAELDELVAPGALRKGEVLPTARSVWQTFTGATPEATGRRAQEIRRELADVLTRSGPGAQNALAAIQGAGAAFPMIGPGAGAMARLGTNALAFATAPRAEERVTNWLGRQ